MRVGHFVPQAWVRTGRGANVSGHIQVAGKSIDLIRQAGHDVELITHHRPADHELPVYLSSGLSPELIIHTVPDAWSRGRELGHDTPHPSRLRPIGLLRQLWAVRQVTKRQGFDVLHLHGRFGTVRFAALLTFLFAVTRLDVPIVVSAIENAPSSTNRLRNRLEQRLLSRIGAVLTPCASVADTYRSLGSDADIVAHGAVRDLRVETDRPRHRVLFWREANHQNGGDLCLRAFERLAPDHPDVSFDLAIRPFWNEEPGVDQIAARHPNVTVHRFPYPDGVSLESLVSEALVVVLPFRSLTMQPQMAVLESVLAGAAVVASDVGSNREVVGSGGVVVQPDDVDAIVEAVAGLVADPAATIDIGRAGADEASQAWSWEHYASHVEVVYQSVRRDSSTSGFRQLR